MIQEKIDNINHYIRDKGRKHLFILISVQLIFLVITASIFIIIENTDEKDYKYENLYKWLILFMFSLSQIYYAWHSIIKKNTLELLAYLIISTCTTIASTLRYFYISINENLNHQLIIQIVCYIYIVFSIIVQIIGYYSYNYFIDAFKDDIFRTIGASIHEQNKFKWFTSFQCLLQVYAQLTILIFITFFFFFDFSIDDTKQYHIGIDIIAIIIIIIGFIIGYIGVKKRNIKMVYIYFIVAFLICVAENIKLFYFMQYHNFDINEINLDWATFTIVAIIFLSSIIILVQIYIKQFFNFYYGYKCIKLKLKYINTFDNNEKNKKKENGSFLSDYDY